MNNYRLKPELRSYFKNNFQTDVEPLKWWKERGVPEEILDIVEKTYITYGHKNGELTKLNSWSSNKTGIDIGTAKYNFTINIEDISNSEKDKFPLTKLMDELQKTTNNFIKDLQL